MRAFVHLRSMLTAHAELTRRIDELEQRYDGHFADVFEAIRELTVPAAPEDRRPRIGFTVDPRSGASAADSTACRSARRTGRR